MKRRTFLRNSAIGLGTFAGRRTLGWTIKENREDGPTGLAEHGPAEPSPAGQRAWGTNAIFLKPAWEKLPSLDELLADNEHTLVLSSFYRVGGEPRPATPTEVRIAYDANRLFVVFRCSEADMDFPVAEQEADWYGQAGMPSGSPATTVTSSPPYPDEVDFLIQPDVQTRRYCQFAGTMAGLKFGCDWMWERIPGRSGRDVGTATFLSQIHAFEASVTRRTNEWVAFFQVPWTTLGGKPQSHFSFLPMRTRWRNGEFSSPVAIDFVESSPVDLLIEAHFSDQGGGKTHQSSLCRLPSGILRWQRPATLHHPDLETLRQIWQMQSSLTVPTDMGNLAQRLDLTQHWLDLLTLEGFNFSRDTGTIATEDMTPAFFRQEINIALQEERSEQACQLLDTYLGRLRKVSSDWFADGSPGNILEHEWATVTYAETFQVKEDVCSIRCLAGGRTFDLHLALPESGGIRIFGNDQGYFKPSRLLPLKAVQSENSCSIATASGNIIINRKPFSISFRDNSGKEVTQICPNSVAFRFSGDGKMLATDFVNRVDPGEVVYGFGERYDRFNQCGNVLTLWGMDDWVGNACGFRNETYKGLPIFHSSKGYMVFSNSSYRLRADVGVMDPGKYRITQHGPIFDYYFWIGDPEKALQSYIALTGKPILPPKWAFEPWIGRGEGAWLQGPLHDAVAEEEETVKKWEALDIPHAAIYAEGPSEDSPALNHSMAARGIKVLGYFKPAVSQEQQESLLPKLKVDELPVLHCGNENSTRDLAYVDFTNPNALQLVRQWWKRRLDLGVAGSMVDYGDLVPEDALFHNGKRGHEMHNFYYYDYHRTVSEVFREKRGEDFILFARGAAPGTQKWLGQFAGDHPSNFDGLKAVLRGALNLCACGFSTWGSDLGGYFGWPEPAVFMRWTQFATFSPLMRPHGKAPRDPWFFGEEAIANYKFHAWVRENLLDYIYNAAIEAHESGISMMRSMPVAFPKEGSLADISDQYMFGEDLLVAPVVAENNSRTVYFPPGQWTSLWDGRVVAGPAKQPIAVPLQRIPVYLGPGAVLPVQMNPDLQLGSSMSQGRVMALLVTPNKGTKTSSRLNAQGRVANITVQPTSRGFAWMLDDFAEVTSLLVYGTAAAETVRVDSKALPRQGSGADSTSGKWEPDLIGNRLIIRLPSSEVETSRSKRIIEVIVK